MGTEASLQIGPGRRGSRGFTLMELMIVLAIAAVVLALGTPNFNEFRRNNRLTSTANDFLASVQLARGEAIKRQRIVSLCASNNPRAANPACSTGAFAGWIVFEDANGDCSRTNTEPVLRGEGPVDTAITAASDGFCASFAPTGFSRDLAAGTEAATVLFCDERGMALQTGTTQSAARGVGLTRTGRGQVTRDPATLTGWGLACP
jgi:type IV fimbrial biogenesis protein FimT